MDAENGWLEIVNVDKLVNFSRRLIYHNFGDSSKDMDDEEFLAAVKKLPKDEIEEMDQVLPFQECKIIAKEYIKKRRHKKTKEISYFIREDDYNNVLIEYNRRMVSNIVASLVSRGALDMAFDDEKNDFIFWVKKEDEEEDIAE
tara:strand:+ start:144 stop:575 length:432 start_codon:yes stop_codon:yes gene_type:complete